MGFGGQFGLKHIYLHLLPLLKGQLEPIHSTLRLAPRLLSTMAEALRAEEALNSWPMWMVMSDKIESYHKCMRRLLEQGRGMRGCLNYMHKC